LIRDILAGLRTDEPQTVIVGPWGDLFLENKIVADGSRPGKLDLFGLGVIAHRVLTGQLPKPDTRYIPGAPPPVASLILRLLSPDSKARPTQRDAEMAVGIMLGLVTQAEEVVEVTRPGDDDPLLTFGDAPADAFDVVDSFDDESETEFGVSVRPAAS